MGHACVWLVWAYAAYVWNFRTNYYHRSWVLYAIWLSPVSVRGDSRIELTAVILYTWLPIRYRGCQLERCHCQNSMLLLI